jgi:hypothetical protein
MKLKIFCRCSFFSFLVRLRKYQHPCSIKDPCTLIITTVTKKIDPFRLTDTTTKLGVKHKTESSEDLPVNCLSGIYNGPNNALVCNKTLIQMSHIKTLKINPTCFDHQLIIIRELFYPG